MGGFYALNSSGGIQNPKNFRGFTHLQKWAALSHSHLRSHCSNSTKWPLCHTWMHCCSLKRGNASERTSGFTMLLYCEYEKKNNKQLKTSHSESLLSWLQCKRAICATVWKKRTCAHNPHNASGPDAQSSLHTVTY